jgi:predicted MFS family arabinose efflux permease
MSQSPPPRAAKYEPEAGVMSVRAATLPAPLVALMISTFAIGTTEFVIIGLLPEVASDLTVTIPLAGLIVSAYALGITLGAPILTALLGAVPKRMLLLGLMAVFIAGNIMSALSPDYGFLIAARIVTAFAHGVFFSSGATMAASLVPPERSGSAIALMFTGLTVAMVTGVPMGTFIGQTFGWRVTFACVAGLGLIAFAGLFLLLPKATGLARPPSIATQFRAFASGRLLLVMAISATGFGGSFVAFTYLAPILRDVTGFGDRAIELILVIYGLGTAFGNIAGGRLADRGPVRTLAVLFVLQACALAVFHFTMGGKIAAMATLAVVSFLSFAPVAGLQLYILRLAERISPDAPNVASALNIAAFNIGIALGSWLGGLVIEATDLRLTPLAGAALAVVALVLLWLSAILDHRTRASSAAIG